MNKQNQNEKPKELCIARILLYIAPKSLSKTWKERKQKEDETSGSREVSIERYGMIFVMYL